MRKISLELRAMSELRSTYKEDAKAIMEVNRPTAFSSSGAKECRLSVHVGYRAGVVLRRYLGCAPDGCDNRADHSRRQARFSIRPASGAGRRWHGRWRHRPR